MNFASTAAMLVAVLLILPALPIALLVFAWKAWPSSWAPSPSRQRVTLAALICASIAAVAMPFLIFGRFFHPVSPGAAPPVGLIVTIVLGFSASLAGLPLAACAVGRVRWLTLLACLLCLAISGFTAVALPH